MESEKVKKTFKPTFAAPKVKTLGVKPKPAASSTKKHNHPDVESSSVRKSTHEENPDHKATKKRQLGPLPAKPKEPKEKLLVRSLSDQEYGDIFDAVFERYPPKSSQEMTEDIADLDPNCPVHGLSPKLSSKEENSEMPLKKENPENIIENKESIMEMNEKRDNHEPNVHVKQEVESDEESQNDEVNDYINEEGSNGNEVNDGNSTDTGGLETISHGVKGVDMDCRADLSEEDSDDEVLVKRHDYGGNILKKAKENGAHNGGKLPRVRNKNTDKTSIKRVSKVKSNSNYVPPQTSQILKSKKSTAKQGTSKSHATVDENERKRKGGARGDSKKKWMSEREIELHGTWVQCSMKHCLKWRYLPALHDPATLPEVWDCSLNPDSDANHCDAPEMEWSEDQHRLNFIFTKFTEGSLVWAKMAGYPWWPGMVEVDPDYETYYECRYQPMAASHYHVVFLDDNVSRAWLSTTYIRPFTGNETSGFGPTTLKGKSHAKLIKVATVKALTAHNMTIEERLRKYSFSRRFHGKWGRAKKRDQIPHSKMPQIKPFKKQDPNPETGDLASLSKLVEEDVDALLEDASDLIEDVEGALGDLLDLDSNPDCAESEPAGEVDDTHVSPNKKTRKEHTRDKNSSLPPKKRKNKETSDENLDQEMPLKKQRAEDDQPPIPKKKSKGLSDSKKTPHDESAEKIWKKKQEKSKKTPKKKGKTNKLAGEVEKVKKHLFKTPSNTPEKPITNDGDGQKKPVGNKESSQSKKHGKKRTLPEVKGDIPDEKRVCHIKASEREQLTEQTEQSSMSEKKIDAATEKEKTLFKKPGSQNEEVISDKTSDHEALDATTPKKNKNKSNNFDEECEYISLNEDTCDSNDRKSKETSISDTVVGIVSESDEAANDSKIDKNSEAASEKFTQEEGSLQDLGPELNLDVSAKRDDEQSSPDFDVEDDILEDLADSADADEVADGADKRSDVHSQKSQDELNLVVEKSNNKTDEKQVETAHDGEDSDFDFEE